MTARGEDIETSSTTKNACNARAQEIVCLLIHGIETEKQFLEQLRWINGSHYQDVVEERAISKMCGYPICEGKIDNVPRKKYHISVSLNKVYDITERKLFCSNQCYKASTYLKAQLHTSPLWMGNRAEAATFSLLKSQTELIGKEVNFETERVKVPSNLKSEPATAGKGNQVEAESRPSVPSNTKSKPETAGRGNQVEPESRSSVETVSHNLREDLEFHVEDELSSEDDDGKNEFDGEKLEPVSKLGMNTPESESREAKLVKNHPEPVSPPNTIREETSSEQSPRILTNSDESVSTENGHVPTKRFKSAKSNRTRAKKPEPPSESLDQLVRHVETCMREWITIDSLRLILGDHAVPNTLSEKSFVDDDRLCAVSERLKMLDVDGATENLESIECEPPSKPLPDFEALREQTEGVKIKVRDFYRGDKKVTFAENEEEDSAEVDALKPTVLPIIHHDAPNVTRRNIVSNRLNSVLSDLCDLFSLSCIEILDKVKHLVQTCHFSAHNITFKSLEWNLIGLILLKLISVNDSHVRISLQSKSKYLTAVLMSYRLEPNYLDLLTGWLTNPESVNPFTRTTL